MEILLVEDSEDDSTFIVNAMAKGKIDARLQIARDGVEALSSIFGEGNDGDGPPVACPKLIILDLNLPRVNGLEVLRQLKGNPQTSSIPVVVLSSSGQKRDVEESYRLGVNSFLVKPMNLDEFGETVRLLCHYWVKLNQPDF